MSQQTRRQAEAIIEQMDTEARDILRHTRMDLDAFLAHASAERAARWQLFDTTAKQDLIIQQLRRAGLEWDAAMVAEWIAYYDAKWGAVPVSDLALPSAEVIATDAKEQAELARQHGDVKGAGQLDRVRLNVLKGARMAWHAGDLLIASLNTPGAVYCVNRAGCSCPNGRAGKCTCWHTALYDRLLDLHAHAAQLADEQAERDARLDYACYEPLPQFDAEPWLCSGPLAAMPADCPDHGPYEGERCPRCEDARAWPADADVRRLARLLTTARAARYGLVAA